MTRDYLLEAQAFHWLGSAASSSYVTYTYIDGQEPVLEAPGV